MKVSKYDGDWVYYDDHQDEVAKLSARIAKLVELVAENEKLRALLKNPCYDDVYCLHCYSPRDECPPGDVRHSKDCKWLEVMGGDRD
jgi:hypothetical protein